MALPVALVADRPWTLHVGARTWGALLGLALLSTALGFVIYFRVLATAGATNVMLVTLLMPVVALLAGSLILGEPVTGAALAGMALIGAGLLAIDGRLLGVRRVTVVPSSSKAADGDRGLPAPPLSGGGSEGSVAPRRVTQPRSGSRAAGTPASPSRRRAAGSASRCRGRSRAGSGAAAR